MQSRWRLVDRVGAVLRGGRRVRPARAGTTLLLAVLLVLGTLSPATAYLPQGLTLDGAGGGAGRVDATFRVGSAVTYKGQPHQFYFDWDTADLRHAWRTDAGWRFETLDGAGGGGGRVNGFVGEVSAALIYNGLPHVWYDGWREGVRHAWYTPGRGWRFEKLYDSISTDMTASLYKGRPHIWFPTGNNVGHGWWTGTRWRFEVLQDKTSAGEQSQVAELTSSLYKDQPHVWFVEAPYNQDGIGARALKHLWYDDGRWRQETLQEHPGMPHHDCFLPGEFAGLVSAEYGQRPHLFFNSITVETRKRCPDEEPVDAVPSVEWRFVDLHWTGTAWRTNVLETASGLAGDKRFPCACPAASIRGERLDLWFNGADGALRHGSYGSGVGAIRTVPQARGNCPCSAVTDGKASVWYMSDAPEFEERDLMYNED